MPPVIEHRRARKSSPCRIRLVNVLAGVAVVCGSAGVVWSLLAPEQVEHAYGVVKEQVHATVDEAVESLTGETIRLVTLGVAGGEEEMDRCDGTFTQMTSYAGSSADVPPVWAAHNNCGGDVILSWELGDRVSLTGPGASTASATHYEVTEIRYAPKIGGEIAALEGLSGELAVQTCYYRPDERMKIIALTPITVAGLANADR